MYLPGVIIFIRSIWLGLVLNFVLSALSDTSFLSNDILADDTGSDVFLPETDEYSLTDQFPDTAPAGDDFFDDTLFADDILANNAQSCGQPLGKVRARENSCPSLEPPAHSTFTESDERTLTADEVEKYWCGDNPAKLSLHHTPVCSLEPYTGPIVNNLRSYMLSGLNYLICQNENMYCCYTWYPNLPLDPTPLALTPVGVGVWCYKTHRFGIPTGLEDFSF